MSRLKKVFIFLFCIFVLTSCYEDEAEIKLNTDGSGTVKGRLVLSERLIVATSEDGGNENTPPISKETVLEEIGPAVDISSITQTEQPDGGRIIEYEGTFSSAEKFFLLEFCRETLKLRLSPAGEGKAVIYCNASQSAASGSGPGPSITQLYGLAKGLYFKRKIHLPAEIEQTNGIIGADKRTVSWAADLRNKEGLAKTKEFVEGKDKGVGSAVFDSSKIKFSLPLKAEAVTEQITTLKSTESEKPSDFKARISSIMINKKMEIDSNSTELKIKDLQLGIEVSWKKDSKPFACHSPVLTNVQDEFNNDLVNSANRFTFQIHGSSYLSRELTVRTKTPDRNITKLKNIQGYVPVIASVEKETITLENMQELVGKENTGNQVLDKLGFKIISIMGSQLNIVIDGGDDTITSIEVFNNDGSEVKRRGGSGWEDNYSYEFAEDVSKLNKCKLEVIVSQDIVKVPFSLDEIKLP